MNAIDKMTDLEKIQAMEQLWQSLTTNNQMPEPPEWHEQILSVRRSRIQPGNTSYTHLSDLKKRGPAL